jgi:hypothetical protein
VCNTSLIDYENAINIHVLAAEHICAVLRGAKGYRL